MEVGDKVLYVPSLNHALETDANGVTVWEIGLKKTVRSNTGKMTEETEVLTSLRRIKEELRTNKDRVVYVKPNRLWKGIVTQVNEDGTVSLDLPGNKTGTTLSYINVKVDHSKTKAHTCCATY